MNAHHSRAALLFVGVSTLLMPSLATASDVADASDGSMVLLLTILGSIGAAYLLAHFLMNRIQRRMLVTSGIEYVLLGILLGSSSGVLSQDAKLLPVLAFGAGWIGLLQGSSLRTADLSSLPKRALRIAMVDLVVVGGGAAVVGFAVLHHALSIPWDDAVLAGSVLGCAATSGSSSATRLLAQRFPQLLTDDVEGSTQSGSVHALIEATGHLTQVFAVLAFGVITCIFHRPIPGVEASPVASEWLLLMLGLGLALGAVFRLLVGNESTDNHRFMAMVGIICFSTGAAFFLDLSALTVNLVLGAVLVQGARGAGIQSSLATTRAPTVLLLLVLAGVVWRPVDPLHGAILAGAAVASRGLFKLLAGAIAASGTPLRPDVGRGFFAQGEVGLCIALSYRLIFRDTVAGGDLVFTAILVSVVLSELAAPRLLRGLLVDAGELRQYGRRP